MRRLIGIIVTVLALAALYEWFVVEAILSEALAAVGVAIVGLLVAIRTRWTRPVGATLSLAFIRPLIVRVLPAIVRESFELLIPVLWKTLVMRRPVRGRWIELRYQARDRSEAHEHARRTIVIFGSNLTPNALPLDVDLERGRLTLHQLVARHESAASDPRYPM